MESKSFSKNWELLYVEEGIVPRHFCTTRMWSSKDNVRKVFLNHVAIIDPELRIIFCPNCKTKAPADLAAIVKLSDVQKELEHGKY